jgi:hypothetical protein
MILDLWFWFCFLALHKIFISVPLCAHMFVSSTVLRRWWDLNIQPHSPDSSLYESAFCKPEDGLRVGRNMSLFH